MQILVPENRVNTLDIPTAAHFGIVLSPGLRSRWIFGDSDSDSDSGFQKPTSTPTAGIHYLSTPADSISDFDSATLPGLRSRLIFGDSD